MDHLLVASLRAMRSLLAPGMLGVFVLSVMATVAALIGFVIAAGFFFAWLAGVLEGHAIASFLPWLGSIGSAMIAWFLFPGIMPVIISFFDQRILRLIERQDYPDAGPEIPSQFWPELLHDARFAALAIFLNLLALPLYLLPGLNLFLFYALNGYLLGCEFFTTAARRHIPLAEAEELRRRHGRVIMAAGVALALLATLPIVNLFAPFWGVAVMAHLYHRVAAPPPLPIYTNRLDLK